MKPIEERLWDFIDGTSSEEERKTIEQLLQTNPSIKQLHEEFLAISNTLKFSELDEPSMRFTKNVMEQIALEPAPKALKTKVDGRIIKAIGGFFVVTLSALVLFSLSQVNWHEGISPFDFTIPTVNWSNYFGSAFVHGAIVIFIICGLAVVDRYRHLRKMAHQ